LGAEIDADPNCRDGRLLLNNLEGIEVILGSTHYLPLLSQMWFEIDELSPENNATIYQEWLSWIKNIAKNPAVNVLAHPGTEVVAIGAMDWFDRDVIADFAEVLQVCREHNTAIEFNVLVARKISSIQLLGYIDMVATAIDMGVKISLGSDSHTLPQIGDFTWIDEITEKIGLREEHFYHPENLS
jgi:histidinol phosphatase-like PHP family hydrolase